MRRLGVICSGGGSVLGEAYRLLNYCGYEFRLAVVTDRRCGAEVICEKLGIPVNRIEFDTHVLFSARAASWLFDIHNVEWTALFFTRLVTKELFSRGPCINFHPSLLPAFKGFGALHRAKKSGSRFVGATAHCVDESLDGGPILAQVSAPINPHITLSELERLSFVQKLYLLLVMCEFTARGELTDFFRSGGAKSGESSLELPISPWANPALRDPRIKDAFDQFLLDEGIYWPCRTSR